MVATPLCIPDNCHWDESSETFSHDHDQPRTSLLAVEAALRKLRSIHTPVCVVSIAGPCRKGKSFIISKAFDQGNVFPLGHTMDPETAGIWMWVVPEKQTDAQGREFTVVLLDSEGMDAVGAQSADDHSIFTLTVLLSSVLIYNSMGVPTRTDLERLDYIIHLSQRIQRSQGQTDQGTFQVFPSFVWLLRDVILGLPTGITNLREYFLEKVFKAGGHPSDKSQKIVDNILKFFPDFDAFPLSPPSSDPEVLQTLTLEGSSGEINSTFIQGVKDFQKVLKVKLHPKRSPTGEGRVTGEALATLVEEYVKTVNTPGMVPSVKRTWDVVTQKKCSVTLANAKATYEGGMIELKCKAGLPCDDNRIRSFHNDYLLQALIFFETETEDIPVTDRWPYMLQLTEYADQFESDMLIENNKLTDDLCIGLMATLRLDCLHPVLNSSWNPEETDFDVLEARIRSAYQTVDSEFRRQARGCRNLCSNWMVVYKEEYEKEMKEHIDRIKLNKTYKQDIDSLRAAKLAQAEENEKIQHKNVRLEADREEIETTMDYLRQKQIVDDRELQRKHEQLMAAQRSQAEMVISAARQQSERDKEKYQHEQRQLEAEISRLRARRDEQERTINNLQQRLNSM